MRIFIHSTTIVTIDVDVERDENKWREVLPCHCPFNIFSFSVLRLVLDGLFFQQKWPATAVLC